MQNLFLTEEDVFEVKLFVGQSEKGTICCDLDEEGVKFLLGRDDIEVEEYTVTFKEPSFGDIIKLTDILLSSRPSELDTVNYEVNPIETKLKTMGFLIKDWDLTDNSGKKIEPIEDNLRKLNPTIATAISLQLIDHLNSNKDVEETIEDTQEEKSE